MNQQILHASLLAFSGTAICLWIFEPIARRIGLVDHPGGRKLHQVPTPLIGGLAMFIAFAFAVLSLEISLFPFRALFAGGLLLIVVGVIDDLQGSSPGIRFGAEIVAALLMAFGGGVYLMDLGWIGLDDSLLNLDLLALPFTVFAVVGVINSLNMIDGLDGLAGSLALVAVSALGFSAWLGGNLAAASILSLCAAAILAFLTFNLRPHGHGLVYMGDAGSMFLGLIIAWFTIDLSQGEERILAPVTALWIFALPLMDTVTVMIRRIFRGRSPFAADHTHCHHLIARFGLAPKQTLLLMFSVAVLLAAIGVAADLADLPESMMFWILVGLYACYFTAIVKAERALGFSNLISPTPS